MNVPDVLRPTIEQVAHLLRSCQRLLFITGAGISAESGLPTYRGVGGLYNVDTTDDGLPVEEILSGSMLRRNPPLTWKYLMQIAAACEGAQFNRAHAIIAEMQSHFSDVCVLTQNVDGFHRAAGSQHVIDLHGDLHELCCTQCSYHTHVETLSVAQLSTHDIPPICPACDAALRPAVVLFGEMLPAEKMDHFLEELERGFDVVFSIGTSSLFPYIAGPVEWARQQGIPTVEINPGTSEISTIVDYRLPLSAGEAMTAIWQQFLQA